MHYLIAYWLEPGSPPAREQALRTYFDLQCHTKRLFDAQQLIVTNIDYPGAIPLILPDGFKREHAIHVKFFALHQILQNGYELPICMHDHDMFLTAAINCDDGAIHCTSAPQGKFSDQLVAFPEQSQEALRVFLEALNRFDCYFGMHTGWGSEARHEGMYSSEVTLANMKPYPFAEIPIKADIPYRDLVSFDIQEHHSLDAIDCDAGPIQAGTKAVHGHINKGPATELLIDWIADTE